MKDNATIMRDNMTAIIEELKILDKKHIKLSNDPEEAMKEISKEMEDLKEPEGFDTMKPAEKVVIYKNLTIKSAAVFYKMSNYIDTLEIPSDTAK